MEPDADRSTHDWECPFCEETMPVWKRPHHLPECPEK